MVIIQRLVSHHKSFTQKYCTNLNNGIKLKISKDQISFKL
jgi:hypothetical protein